jgi:hypothetical protein
MPYGLSTRFTCCDRHLGVLAVVASARYESRRMRLVAVTAVLVSLLALAGCGGDNLSLCDGCSTPTPRPSVTPTSSSSVPTPTTTPTPLL